MNIESFEEKDFIGDWVLDLNIKIDPDTVLDELAIIASVEEEFCFHLYDAMISAEFLGLDIEDIQRSAKTSFIAEKLRKELSDIMSTSRK